MGLEVGVSTGRFAVPLGIRIGVEPANAMAEIARKRGIEVYDAKGEKLPFDDESFGLFVDGHHSMLSAQPPSGTSRSNKSS